MRWRVIGDRLREEGEIGDRLREEGEIADSLVLLLGTNLSDHVMGDTGRARQKLRQTEVCNYL